MRSPAPTDRPTLASSRRTSWRAFLLQEWGLLLLAAVLALIVWKITSDRVIQPFKIGSVEVVLEVEPAIRDRVGAVLTGPNTFDLELVCSEREYNEAREALDRGGKPQVGLRVGTAPESGSRVFNTDDHYAWPFANHERILAPNTARFPAGRVFALAPAHPRVDWADEDAATVPTRTALKEGREIRVSITVSRDTVSVLAPKGRENEAAYTVLTPDPINLVSVVGELVADGDVPFDRPLVYDLTFEGWRNPRDEVERAWRRQLDIPAIQATVTLTQIATSTPKNGVVLQLSDDYEVELDRVGIPGLSSVGKLTFTGTLIGPKGILDALERDPEGWAWGIDVLDRANLPDSTMGGGGEFLKVDARLFWYPKKVEYRDHGVRFKPERGQDVFSIKVRWNPRKP